MTINTSVPRSRRALLAGGLGGAAALVASALGRPLPASAGDGQAVLVGGEYSATSVTKLYRMGGRALEGDSTSGWGVWGQSTSGAGVYGWSDSGEGVGAWSNSNNGVTGESSTLSGVYGWSDSGTGVSGASTSGTGVSGGSDGDAPGIYGTSKGGPGVHGQSTANRGVYGQATSGVGVFGYATTGYALRTSGRLKVDKASGVATIAATKTSIMVTPGLDVTAASFVLLTPKADLGTRRLWYTTNTIANTFTIKVSTAVTANLQIGWLLLG